MTIKLLKGMIVKTSVGNTLTACAGDIVDVDDNFGKKVVAQRRATLAEKTKPKAQKEMKKQMSER